jgi:hypothetical protein
MFPVRVILYILKGLYYPKKVLAGGSLVFGNLTNLCTYYSSSNNLQEEIPAYNFIF